jgi:hypothetical protein
MPTVLLGPFIEAADATSPSIVLATLTYIT